MSFCCSARRNRATRWASVKSCTSLDNVSRRKDVRALAHVFLFPAQSPHLRGQPPVTVPLRQLTEHLFERSNNFFLGGGHVAHQLQQWFAQRRGIAWHRSHRACADLHGPVSTHRSCDARSWARRSRSARECRRVIARVGPWSLGCPGGYSAMSLISSATCDSMPSLGCPSRCCTCR